MSLTPEQPLRPPEGLPPEGGASHGNVTPINVVCNREDIAKAVRDMLDQPLMRQAVIAAFPEAAVEGLAKPPTTLKLTQSRSPTAGVIIRGDEAVIEYSDRAASNGSALGHIQRELLKKALIETALTGLRHFSSNTALPIGCREEIQAFAQGIAKTEALTTSELRSIVSDVIRAEHDRLQRQKERLFKKLRECSASPHLSAEALESRITTASSLTRVIMAISLLVDQSGARPENSEFKEKRHTNPRAKVVEDLDLVIKELALNPRTLWYRAVFDGDFARADAIARLRETLRAKFKFDGFNTTLPSFLSTDSSLSVQANIDRLLRGSAGTSLGTPAKSRFSPESLTNTSAYVAQALATTKLEQDLRSWSTPDPDPSGLLREDLLTICQSVPAALHDLRENLPAALPTPIQEFLKTLCLYRLHGGTEGAAYFASVACHHTPEEARNSSQLRRAFISAVDRGDDEATLVANEALQLFLSQIPASHPEDYVSLVNFVASWPLMISATEREIALGAIFGRLSALATSVVYTSTKTLEESFLRNMSDPSRFDITILEQFGHDVAGLAEAAKTLANPEVSAYMAPVTTSLTNLIDVLKVETTDPRQQLQHFGRVKRAFGRQHELVASSARMGDATNALEATIQAIYDRIQPLYESLTSRLPTYAPQLRQELTELDKAGDIPVFAERIADAIAVVSSLEPSEISQEIEALIDTKVIPVVNMLGDALQYDQGIAIADLDVARPAAANLGFSRVSAALCASTWCAAQLDTLREIFSKSSFYNRAVRINHIDNIKNDGRKQLRAALLKHPDLLTDYARVAAAQIKDTSARNPSMIQAAEHFLDLDLDLRLPKFEAAREARTKLQDSLAEIKKEALRTTAKPS